MLHSLLGFGNLKAELFCIAFLSIALTVLLLCGYWQKKLIEKDEEISLKPHNDCNE